MWLVLCMWAVGGECGDTVVGDGVVCGGGECDDTVVGDGVVSPMWIVWESRLVPTFAVWVLWGLEVHCSGLAFLGFLVPFIL